MNQSSKHLATRILALALGTTLGLASFPSVSRADGAYAGVGAGTSRADVLCDLDISCTADDSDTGIKIFAGFQFVPEIAVEVAYVDLGEASITGNDFTLGATRITFETSGVNVAAVASLPMNETFAFTAKGGLFLWNVDETAFSNVFGPGSLSESGTSFMVGLGGTINLARQVALRLEWEGFFDVGDENTTGQSDLDLLSAGILIRFQ